MEKVIRVRNLGRLFFFFFGCRTSKLLNCFGSEGKGRKADSKLFDLANYLNVGSICSAGTYFC